jgi:RNA polymerase sigma factor (TIGR02999 family)
VHTKWNNLVCDGQDYGALFQNLYVELKQMARAKVSMERPGITLNATALVHEAWLRLEKSAPDEWRDRSQFFASAAEAMRRILVEAARRRAAVKRGSGQTPVALDGLEVEDRPDDRRLMEVNEVLDELAAEDPIKAAIVKMRVFCGLENEEIAAILEVNEKTVRRHWELAKVWLFRAIRGGN